MNAMNDPTARAFERALARFNSHVLGTVTGLIAAAGFFVATIVLLLHGGENPGPMLGLLRHLFPGYSVSVGGAFVGALWAGGVFYVIGAILARAYGPWVLQPTPRGESGAELEEEPSQSVGLLRPLPVALTTGAFLAFGVFLVTNWLSFVAGTQNPHLALLSHYLPGYTTDFPGSVIGAIWAFLYGLVAAGCIAWIYDGIVAWRHPASARNGS